MHNTLVTTAKRSYGVTEIQLSPLGLGAAQIGDPSITESASAVFLHFALDAGIALIDTAPSYALSEQRIGRHLAPRRNEFILSTKLGYGVDGIEDWTGPCITAGVVRALHVMHTDYIDIGHLHSCPLVTLQRGDIIEALERAKREGKIRAIAYSGENEDLAYAIRMNRFDGFMASLNICDQRVINDALPLIANKGFIAKRPAANHPWRFAAQPVGNYCEEYWQRWRAMKLDNRGLEWGEVALRFALSISSVSSAIIGTGSIGHLKQNIEWAAKGPLDKDWITALREAFMRHDTGWNGQI